LRVRLEIRGWRLEGCKSNCRVITMRSYGALKNWVDLSATNQTSLWDEEVIIVPLGTAGW